VTVRVAPARPAQRRANQIKSDPLRAWAAPGSAPAPPRPSGRPAAARPPSLTTGPPRARRRSLPAERPPMAPTTESCLGLGEKWLQRLRVVWVWVRGAPPPPRARGPWPPGRLPCTAKKCFLTGRPGVPREPAPPPTAPSAGARAIREPRGGSRAHARWPGRRWSGHRGRPRLQRARSARRVERTECASMPRAAPRDVSNVPTVAGRPPGCGSAAGRPPPRALSSQRTPVRNVPSPLPPCSSSPSESPSPCESHSVACSAPSPGSPENHAS
jgi:hypothetical protein